MHLPDFLPTHAILEVLASAPRGYALVDPQTHKVLWSNGHYDRQIALSSDCRTIQAAIEGIESATDRGEASSPRVSPQESSSSPYQVSVRHIETGEGPLLLLTLFSATDHSECAGATAEAPTRDSLTGLADRGALDRRMATLAQTPPDQWPPLTLLFIDLDGFKLINDQHGHLIGDQVISAVSRRIAAAVRADDFLARYGGDEFVIIAEGLRPGHRLDLLVQRIRTAAQEPVETEMGHLTLSASIGVAYSGEGFASPREMLATADERMYADKRQSRPPSA